MRRTRLEGMLALVATFCLWQGVCVAQIKPTLSLDFNGNVNGVRAGGQVVAPRIEGHPELADGKFGKALKSGPKTGYLWFPSKDILSREEGTVEMWVCPVDWNDEETQSHLFFKNEGDGYLWLYRHFAGGSLMDCCESGDTAIHTSSGGTLSWAPRVWHHIAGAWSQAGAYFYVDGKLVKSSAGDADASKAWRGVQYRRS